MSKKNQDLTEYNKKRDFRKTPEPKGEKKRTLKKRIFVIQKHQASHLHFDFRLEFDGVLHSWAIPKGPSLDPSVKRLAAMTEPHPIEYAKFEGVIPEGEYGGGTVMIWDIGTYENIKQKDGKKVPMDICLKEGRIEVWLNGKVLQGGFALIKFKNEKKQWLLIKMNDEYASKKRNPVNTQTHSAVSGRTMTQIRKEES